MNPDWNRHSYYTHQPMLKFYSERTRKPILELGCGNGSTQLLHEICLAKHIQLFTLESDLKWLDRFREMETKDHAFVHVGDSWTETVSGLGVGLHRPVTVGSAHTHDAPVKGHDGYNYDSRCRLFSRKGAVWARVDVDHTKQSGKLRF